jgi:hypothetical protein
LGEILVSRGSVRKVLEKFMAAAGILRRGIFASGNFIGWL